MALSPADIEAWVRFVKLLDEVVQNPECQEPHDDL